MATLLLVEDRAPLRQMFAKFLSQLGHEVREAESAEQGLLLLRESEVAFVLADYMLPGMDGIQFLMRLTEIECQAPVVLMTAFGEVKTAVTAMKQGAFDFLEKPVDLDHLRLVLQRALELRSLKNEQQILHREAACGKTLVGSAPSLLAVLALADRLAQSRTHALILGESGTGKELLARRIHEQSPRFARAFVSLNCASIPAELLESELFGHEKGSFTGAHARKLGLFEMAEGGSLFLDEIGELPLSLQPKLLRAIQEGEFRRVGGSQVIKADLRLIFATNRDLEAEVRLGRFREDLYFRISIFPITMPPLRNRMEDLQTLALHFLARFGHPQKRLDPEVLAALSRYPWPGNVRELENALERAVILSRDGVIRREHLPESLVADSVRLVVPLNLHHTIKENLAQVEELVEQRLIDWVLRDCQGNKEVAARRLGVSVRTLYNRLQEGKGQKEDGL
jgi:DNA-binding NtrC family response regulator